MSYVSKNIPIFKVTSKFEALEHYSMILFFDLICKSNKLSVNGYKATRTVVSIK